MQFLSDAVFALAVWSVVLVIVVPLLGVYLLTLLDAIFRVDIGISKLTWTGVVLLLPIAGVLLYWMLRPKRFNPLLESEEPYGAVPYRVIVAQPVEAPPPPPVAVRPRLTVVPRNVEEAADEEETTLPRAA